MTKVMSPIEKNTLVRFQEDTEDDDVGELSIETDITKTFFRDKKREIDYILVCTIQALNSTEERYIILKFLDNLDSQGIQSELSRGLDFSDLMFIKLHGPRPLLMRYADSFNIPLVSQSQNYRLKGNVYFSFMTTDIIRFSVNSPILRRAPRALSLDRPTSITGVERIMVLNMILSKTSFGSKPLDYGIQKLLKRGFFIAAYPLHSGAWSWSEHGNLSKRQLLAEYWANIRMWYKLQPITLIEKYFGTEVALYFAYFGFYNKLLLVASIVGLLCFVCGLISTQLMEYYPITEICQSSIILCPAHFKNPKWEFSKLNETCSYGKLTYLFDNSATIVFAIFMTIWATLFTEFWKRKYNILLLHFNIGSEIALDDLRREFKENSNYRRICPITGVLEPYVPIKIKIINYSITSVTCLFMICIVLAALFGTIIYRLTLTTSKRRKSTFLTLTTSSLINVIFIKIFGKFYSRISLWLTIRENPRTQAEFDDSYIYKKFLLSFVNNYVALAYVAFIKGKLYTYPGDSEKLIKLGGVPADYCHPAGCIADVCVQLAFIMLFKSLIGNICTLLYPIIKKWCRSIFQDSDETITLPQWEQDYDLQEIERYFLTGEYMEMMMQYGFVTFFAAAFPLAPLCAFINNVIELRTDANKYVRNYRRPVPTRTGLRAWNGILKAMSFISIFTNAFVIAFTSDFVKREIYKYNVDVSLKGFINSTLSVFDTKDINYLKIPSQRCYYRGNRNSPDHEKKYQLSSNYWFELSMRFLTALIFEIVMLIVAGFLSYVIPDIPHSVKVQLQYEQNKIKEQRLKAIK